MERVVGSLIPAALIASWRICAVRPPRKKPVPLVPPSLSPPFRLPPFPAPFPLPSSLLRLVAACGPALRPSPSHIPQLRRRRQETWASTSRTPSCSSSPRAAYTSSLRSPGAPCCISRCASSSRGPCSSCQVFLEHGKPDRLPVFPFGSSVRGCRGRCGRLARGKGLRAPVRSQAPPLRRALSASRAGAFCRPGAAAPRRPTAARTSRQARLNAEPPRLPSSPPYASPSCPAPLLPRASIAGR